MNLFSTLLSYRILPRKTDLYCRIEVLICPPRHFFYVWWKILVVFRLPYVGCFRMSYNEKISLLHQDKGTRSCGRPKIMTFTRIQSFFHDAKLYNNKWCSVDVSQKTRHSQTTWLLIYDKSFTRPTPKTSIRKPSLSAGDKFWVRNRLSPRQNYRIRLFPDGIRAHGVMCRNIYSIR